MNGNSWPWFKPLESGEYICMYGNMFTIFTDHAPLQYLHKQKHLSARQIRWMTRLAEYDYEVKYKPGKHNSVADALSRQINVITTMHACPSFKKALLDEYEEAENLKTLLHTTSTGVTSEEYEIKEGLLYRNTNLLITGRKLKDQLIKEAHEIPISGHLGTQKTLSQLKRHVTWNNMETDIKEYVKHCETCQRIKSSNQKPAGQLMPLDIPSAPWEQITMDFITHLPETARSHDAILTIVDKFTKKIIIETTTTSATAVDTARSVFDKMFRYHGLPQKIISDLCSQLLTPPFPAHGYTISALHR